MANRDEIVAFCDQLLDAGSFDDYGPNGLQVPGAVEVTSVATGVSANLEFLNQAIAAGAQLALVHHGLLWGERLGPLSVPFSGRLRALLGADASLLAYHLPLDAHPELGNAAQLAVRLGATPVGAFGGVGLGCTIEPLSVEALGARVREVAGRDPLVFPHGPAEIRRLAISTGAAGYDLVQAAHEGYDALLTGEPEEPNQAASRELGIHLFAAGHHATERLGVQALAAHLADRFGLEWHYVEVDNPV
jgi:dinuclear metal center YbgI/SA1388 family protein